MVLSEDVDTLMFGCGRTLRNWSSEGARGNHAPTHITIYDAKATKEGKSGLDREGMILVALMSGGDYITEGIPGCGIKVACEAARAGFGKSLCSLSRTDTNGLKKWREELIHELQTNESKHFRIKHKALQIPESFPNKEVLGYYTHPVVSSATKLARLKEEIEWDGEIDVAGLRTFAAEAFNWTHKFGAKKFIRGLAPALLVSKVRARANARASGFDDVLYTAMNEMDLVREICGRRQHFSTDGIPELRLVYHPATIVGLDLDAEADESEDYGRDGLAPLGDDENLQTYCTEDESDDSSRTRSRSPRKRNATNYDPTELQKVWVPETIAKIGIALMVEDYEEALRNPQKPNKSKVASKRTAAYGGMPQGALDRYVTIVKPPIGPQKPQSPKKMRSVPQNLPPAYLAPLLNDLSPTRPLGTSKAGHSESLPANETTSRQGVRRAFAAEKSKIKTGAQRKGQTSENPWTIARPSSPATQRSHISTVHISKPGITSEKTTTSCLSIKSCEEAPSVRETFTRSPLSSPFPLKKHSRPTSSSSNTETPLCFPRISHLASPIKKRIPHPSTRSAVPATSAKQIKADTQGVINIPSSPIPASRSELPLNNITESSATKAVQEPMQKTLEVKANEKRNKFVVLRESLEGAWKEVGQEPTGERARGRVWRASAVEVLDMTED